MPLYAAQAQGAFRRAGLDVAFLEPVAGPERVQRLRAGDVALGLMDVAALVDTVATVPTFDARCVLVLTQRLPMAAHFVRGRAVADPDDLRRARYGAPAGTGFVSEHAALLRRLGGADPALHVDMPYAARFAALANDEIDVAPDFAAIAPRFERALGGHALGTLRYRDCGVRAYGIGWVASRKGLAEQRDEIRAFLQVVCDAYERMRDDPAALIAVATSQLPDLDAGYALAEWHGEEEGAIFGYDGLGAATTELWAETAAWRQEVAGFDVAPGPELLFDDVFAGSPPPSSSLQHTAS